MPLVDRLPALLATAATGIAVLLLAGRAAAAIAVIGALATLLLAPRDADEPPPPRAEPGDPRALVDAVVEAIDEPILLIEYGQVTLANAAAVALLGRHVVGQDARLAIRDPAAADYLAGEDAGAQPVHLSSLGAIGQRWEMRVAATAEGIRVVRLTERSMEAVAERMRTDFVANASHELRTPLASILGYVETLQGEAGDEPPLRARFLQVVLEEARRMQRLVQDLMSLSRIEADRFRAPAERVELTRLAREVVAELASSPRGREIAPIADSPPLVVLGDRAQLSQVLHNVVGNALAYGRPGTPVVVELAHDGAMARATVIDRGDGIAPEHLPRLTERFYRVDASRSRAAGGTGLGLAIVKHVVERHRGRLLIDSVPSQGTRVTVCLPIVTEP